MGDWLTFLGVLAGGGIATGSQIIVSRTAGSQAARARAAEVTVSRDERQIEALLGLQEAVGKLRNRWLELRRDEWRADETLVDEVERLVGAFDMLVPRVAQASVRAAAATWFDYCEQLARNDDGANAESERSLWHAFNDSLGEDLRRRPKEPD